MVEKPKAARSAFVKAAAAIAIIFGAGLALGAMLDSFRISFLNEELITANIETESFLTSQAYLAGHEDYCALMHNYLAALSRRVEQLGEDLSSLGSKMVFMNSTFLDRRYFLYEIRLWLIVESYKERCNKSVNTILFFYSDGDDASFTQGLVLTSIKQKYQDNVMIFSFKHGFDEPALRLIEEDYGIASSPSLVINGKLYSGFVSKGNLEKIMG
ncbi:MAG: hypothetical protein QW548_02545 [Candidatus Aenigmatarchaeota archaeon]